MRNRSIIVILVRPKLFVILLCIAFSASLALAEELPQVGMFLEGFQAIVKSRTGLTRIQSHSQPNKDVPLLWGDSVLTDSGGYAKININPGTSLYVKEGSLVKILGNVIQNKNGKFVAEAALQFLRGGSSAKTETPAGSKTRNRIYSPRTVSTIRGTTYDITVKNNTTQIMVIEGNVEVSDLLTDKVYGVSSGEVLLPDAGEVTVRSFAESEISNMSEIAKLERPSKNSAQLPSASDGVGNMRDESQASKWSALLDSESEATRRELKKQAIAAFQKERQRLRGPDNRLRPKFK